LKKINQNNEYQLVLVPRHLERIGEIENIIGTISTTGAKFAQTLEKHLKEYEIAFKEGHLVKEIKEDGKDKIFVTDDGKSYKTKTVIVATE